MKLKDYTILLVPDHTAKVHRIRLTSRRAKALLILGGAGLILFLFFGISYFVSLGQSKHLALLEAENQDLKVQFKALSQQMTSVQNKLNRINELDHRIRLAIGIEQNQNSEVGVGGPDVDSPAMSQLLPQEQASQIKKIAVKLSRLDLNLGTQELSLEELDAYLEDNEALIMATPSIWPVQGWVTSGFGERLSPFYGERAIHEGIDIAAPVGTLIRASASGIVIQASWDQGYGNLVTIAHGYGITTRYGHCAEILVQKGEAVKRGQVIATVGATGRATGPHLHYEVRIYGVPVNPLRYIFE